MTSTEFQFQGAMQLHEQRGSRTFTSLSNCKRQKRCCFVLHQAPKHWNALRPLPGLIFFTAEEQEEEEEQRRRRRRKRRRRRRRSTDQIRFLGVETEIWIWDWTKHGSPGMAGSVTNQREEPPADNHHAWTTRILVVCVFPTCQYNAGSAASVVPMNVLMYSVYIMYLYLCVYVLCLFYVFSLYQWEICWDWFLEEVKMQKLMV